MIKIVILIIMILILINSIEPMENYYFINELDKKGINSKCCLVEKKYDEKGFYYHYIKTNCENKPDFINKSRLLTNKQFPYKLCNYYELNKKKNKKFPERLGSCRRIDRECVDFVNKKTCDKYDMRWEPVPCNTPIKYVNKMKIYSKELKI